jgi:hypothetical protein
MINQKAQAGREWISQAFIIFKRQPFELLLLLLALIFVKLVTSLFPFLGEVLPIIISPALGMGFMYATREVDEGRKFKILILLVAFKSPQIRPLLMLGGLYVLAFFVALACSISFDNGVLWDHALGIKTMDPKNFDKSGVGTSALITMLAFIPATLILWFTAPLIMWQNMGLVKAIFYSAVAVWRSIKAILIYFMSWISIILVLSLIFSVVIMIVPAIAGLLQTFVLIPLMIALTVILQCSFYTSYVSIFGRPEMEKKVVESVDE